MHNLNEIKVWKKAIELSKIVYQNTQNYPTEEKYGLVTQMRRSAVSVASNIAEGAGRNSNKEYTHFLGIARGSSYELQTQIIISLQLNYLKGYNSDEMLKIIDEIQKMIYGFTQSLISNLASKI